MKKKLFFLPALAALFFSSCSSDEPTSSENGEVNENGGFLAVNIMSPSGSRGTSDSDDFQIGSDEENAAAKAMFLFFDANGNPTQTPQIVDLAWTNENTTTPQVEKISQAIVSVAGKTTPTQMLVVLNPGTIRLAGYNLSSVLNKVENFNTPLGAFVMTNSVYKDGTIKNTTPLRAEDVKESSDAAKEAAVDVYVERIVAKIHTNANTNFTVNNTPISTADGENIVIKPVVKGIKVANVANECYLYKNVKDIDTWITNWPAVNDISNKRCYWAAPCADKTFTNYDWTNIADPLIADQNYYVKENTNITNQTSVIITAELKYTEDGEEKDAKLVKWAGNYYLKDKFTARFATLINNKGYKIAKTVDGTTNYRTFAYNDEKKDVRYLTTAERLTEDAKAAGLRAFESAGHLNVTLQADEKFVIEKNDGSYEDVTADQINKFLLEAANRVWLWEGKSYYYVPIEHFGLKGTSFDYSKGVIRNHIYDLTLNSLSGLGTPVVDDSQVIIPEKPEEKLFYVAAKMHILKWRIVHQTVDFGD